MLFREGGAIWAQHRAPARVHTEIAVPAEDGRQLSHRATLALRCLFAGQSDDGLLDTGAEWTVLNREMGEVLRAEGCLGDPIGTVEIASRLGSFAGDLYELDVTLLAEEGADIEVAAKVVISDDWWGPTVLGYRGLLELVRLGVEPAHGVAETTWVYFGKD
ncbi:MAG: hypothetical protein KC503_00830 [Myxococcales bacterium]|nr:hypothetical protein [Myxococcales bacterium]